MTISITLYVILETNMKQTIYNNILDSHNAYVIYIH